MNKYAVKLLALIPEIGRLIDHYNTQLRYQACKTHNMTCNNTNTIYKQIQRLESIAYQRDLLCQLKSAVVDSINSLCNSDKSLLVWVYVKRIDKDVICRKLNFSRRTLYRKCNIAMQRFVRNLSKQGIDYNWLCQYIKPIVNS